MLEGQKLRKLFSYLEILAIALNIFLLPIDRFPYVHHIPLRLGLIAFVLLAIAAAGRLAGIIKYRRRTDLKRIALIGLLLLLPVAAYAQSVGYALDKPLAEGATKLLLVVTLKAWFFFILVYSNQSLWRTVKLSVYAITALAVAFGFFQFIFDVFGAPMSVTDLRSCCTSNSTYVFSPRPFRFDRAAVFRPFPAAAAVVDDMGFL